MPLTSQFRKCTYIHHGNYQQIFNGVIWPTEVLSELQNGFSNILMLPCKCSVGLWAKCPLTLKCLQLDPIDQQLVLQGFLLHVHLLYSLVKYRNGWAYVIDASFVFHQDMPNCLVNWHVSLSLEISWDLPRFETSIWPNYISLCAQGHLVLI